eukprot:m.104321 g.104321  ORF g.104321 m.104321 type:complete len:712 (-) comp15753_c0_seq1:244-2379(-)
MRSRDELQKLSQQLDEDTQQLNSLLQGGGDSSDISDDEDGGNNNVDVRRRSLDLGDDDDDDDEGDEEEDEEGRGGEISPGQDGASSLQASGKRPSSQNLFQQQQQQHSKRRHVAADEGDAGGSDQAGEAGAAGAGVQTLSGHQRALLEKSLASVQRYQSWLHSQLDLIKASRHRLQLLLDTPDDGVRHPSRMRRSFFATDADAPREDPALQPHLRRKAQLIAAHRMRVWTDAENAKLQEGVRQQNLKARADLVLSDPEYQRILDVPAAERTKQQLDRLKTFKAMMNPPAKVLFSSVKDVDWDAVSRDYMHDRSGPECKMHWLFYLSPAVNRLPWTKEEDAALLKIVMTKDNHMTWDDIALRLDTRRTGLQCLQRYQQSLNKDMVKHGWTSADDAVLRQLMHDVEGQADWQFVAEHLPGRTGQQCLHRWQKSLDPTRVTGVWTELESKQLQEAVDMLGEKWSKVQMYVPGRTDVQCRERFYNTVADSPILKFHAWSEEEDRALLEVVDKIGHSKWVQVAAALEAYNVHRKDDQCRRRWIVLRPDDYKNLKQSRRVTQQFLPQCHVGRAVSRSKVTAEDLAPVVRDSLFISSFGVAAPGCTPTLARTIPPLPPIRSSVACLQQVARDVRDLQQEQQQQPQQPDAAAVDEQAVSQLPAYNVLYNRLRSLFFWPTLMATAPPANGDAAVGSAAGEAAADSSAATTNVAPSSTETS